MVSAGFAEAGAEGAAAQRALIETAHAAGPAGGRPEQHGGGQHRSVGTPERHARARAAGGRPGRVLQPVRRARGGPARRGRPPRARPVQLRVGRQPRRRLRQRPAAVLAGRSRHRRGPALPGDVRQPAQVRPAGPADEPGEAGRRGGLGDPPARPRRRPARPGRERGHRPVRPLRRDPGGHRRRAVRRRHPAGPPAAAGRPAGRRGGQLVGAVRPGVAACRANGLTVAEGYPRDISPQAGAHEFADALADAAVDERVDALVVVFAPPLPGQLPDEDADFAAALGSVALAGEKPTVATFLLGQSAAARAGLPVGRGGGPRPRPGRVLRGLAARAARRDPRPARHRLPTAVDAPPSDLLAAYGIPVVPSRRRARPRRGARRGRRPSATRWR